VVDPFKVKKTIEVIKRAMQHNGPAVVICRQECAYNMLKRLSKEGKTPPLYEVDKEKCIGCGTCSREFGCPAIRMENGKAVIDEYYCTGCGACAEVCPVGAIRRRIK